MTDDQMVGDDDKLYLAKFSNQRVRKSEAVFFLLSTVGICTPNVANTAAVLRLTFTLNVNEQSLWWDQDCQVT